MHSIIRPVRIGLFLGILTMMFGIFWAVFLTVRHEDIHRSLNERAAASFHEKFVLSGAGHGADAHGHDHSAMKMSEDESSSHDHAAMSMGEEGAAHEDLHADGVMGEAHKRLTRGHIHAMGLGLVSIAVSFILAFLNAPGRVKTFASACAGVGGLFYPFAWIIMGFRTVTLGAEGASGSVMPIVAFSVTLVLIGLLMAFYYLLKGVLKGD